MADNSENVGTAANGESAQDAPPDTWKTQKFKNRCDCEFCKLGKATTHNDPSHDQTLHLTWTMDAGNDPAVEKFEIVGGTTKCARVMSKFFESSKDFGREFFQSKTICEVGSGTGLVGLCCAMLGADSVLTDQSIVMDLLGENVEAALKNVKQSENLCGKVTLCELYWGESKLPKKIEDSSVDVVIGCDLIFAKENIPLLLNIFSLMCPPEQNKEVLFAHIWRFSYEEQFFEGMKKNGFSDELIYKEDEILLYRFKRIGTEEITEDVAKLKVEV